MNCQRMSSSAERQFKSCIGKLRVIWKSLWRTPWRTMLGRLRAISTQSLYTTWKLAELQKCFSLLFFSVARFTNPLLYKFLDMASRLGGSSFYRQGHKSDCLNCAFWNLIFHPSFKSSRLGAPRWAWKENYVSNKIHVKCSTVTENPNI